MFAFLPTKYIIFHFQKKLNLCLFFAYMHIIKLLLCCVYFPDADAGITPKELKRIRWVMLLLLAKTTLSGVNRTAAVYFAAQRSRSPEPGIGENSAPVGAVQDTAG